MPAIDLKTFVTLLSLLAAGVSSVVSIKTDIAGAKVDIVAVQGDIEDIRATQLSSATQLQKLYDAVIASNVAMVP